MTLSRMLEDMGFFNLRTASTKEEAFEIIHNESIEVALLDVFLYGERDGIKIAEDLTQNHHIPFIFITASYDPDTYMLMNNTFHSGILEKPYEYEIIKKALDNIVSTDILKVSQELKNSNTQQKGKVDQILGFVLDSLKDGVCITDNYSNIQEVNYAFCEMLECDRHQIIGTNITEILPDLEKHQKQSLDRSTHKSRWQQTIVTKNGYLASLEITTSVNQTENAFNRVIILSDISHKKKYEQQIQANRQLEQEIHHRIKNSLNTVSGLLYIEESEAPDHASKGILKRVRSRTQTLAIVHHQFFDRSNQSTISTVDLVDRLVEETLTEEEKSSFQFTNSIEDIQLDNDAAIKVGAIIYELIANAQTSTKNPNEAQNIIIHLESDFPHLEIYVEDDGCESEDEPDFDALGLKIVQSLSGEGNFLLSRNEHGRRCSVSIKDILTL